MGASPFRPDRERVNAASADSEIVGVPIDATSTTRQVSRTVAFGRRCDRRRALPRRALASEVARVRDEALKEWIATSGLSNSMRSRRVRELGRRLDFGRKKRVRCVNAGAGMVVMTGREDILPKVRFAREAYRGCGLFK